MGIVVLEADLEVHSLHEVPLFGLERVLQELRDGVLQGVLWDFPAKNITLLKMNIQLEFGQRRLLAKKKHVRTDMELGPLWNAFLFDVCRPRLQKTCK